MSQRLYGLAVLDITPGGVRVRDIAEGLDFASVQERTAVPLLR